MANRELVSLSLYSLLASNRGGLFIVFLPLYLVDLKGATLPVGLFIAAELALAIGGPAYTAYVADVTRAGERGAGYGLLNATSSAGGVVGVILAGVVTFEFGLVALFPFVIAVMVGTL